MTDLPERIWGFQRHDPDKVYAFPWRGRDDDVEYIRHDIHLAEVAGAVAVERARLAKVAVASERARLAARIRALKNEPWGPEGYEALDVVLEIVEKGGGE